MEYYNLECECGAIIQGRNKHHAEENLKIHKKSNKHKSQMTIRLSGANIIQLNRGEEKKVKR